MFYRCSKCGKLLTEFDVNFNNNLKGSVDAKNCKCANCLANIKLLKDIKKNKPRIINYIFPYISIFWFLIMIYAEPLGITNYINHDDIIFPCSFVALIGYIVCVIFCIKDYNLTDESFEYNVLETSYNSSGSLITTTKTEYGGDDKAGEKFMLFVFFPFWGLIRYVYLIVNFHRIKNKNFTVDVIGAYDKTIKETEEFILPNKFCYPHNIQEMFKIKMEKYKEARQQIISKYKYLENNQVKIQIKKLKKPTITLRSNQTVYRLLFILNDISFVVDDLGAKKIIFNNYTIYSDDKKYIIDLFDLVNKIIENNSDINYLKLMEILKV